MVKQVEKVVMDENDVKYKIKKQILNLYKSLVVIMLDDKPERVEKSDAIEMFKRQIDMYLKRTTFLDDEEKPGCGTKLDISLKELAQSLIILNTLAINNFCGRSYKAFSFREYGAIDDVDIDLHIDVSFLDEEIAVAWDVIRTEPVIVRLHCSLTQYLNGPVPTVDVFQTSTKDRFGLGHQLKKIMQTFVTHQWKQNSKEKLNCPHGKKISEKKVKSPLHIFSSLRRSPSYPPPGCGKSKSKLKPEQDGITKSQKLLKRSCSNAIKVEDGCDSKPHKPLGRSFTSDTRAEQANSTKPHKLLSRSCSATVRLDENLPLKPHKLLSRTCSGDPRCEHNSAPKPHKLLSKSCSSTLKTEDSDGLKHHKLLSRSYSSNAKVGKTELCKEPTSEGRRLSLTSGLIGILAPSSSSQPTRVVVTWSALSD
ncbi:protein mono-ADP-ribosyltransferase PARP8-like [Rhincodon typus]|uniref:protein mono-ADP-ribosyltransferase PARP8-like n=1 Tax=Rhincodon typus TaxID=259920 RepID=UPI00202F220D|nr:protein mono-ADP-ribosyltransferase PARP8-like [Rhincodon typus]